MPHNLVMVNPGKADEVGQAAINLGAGGFDVAFVPQSKEILWASKLIDHKQEEIIEFKAPSQAWGLPICLHLSWSPLRDAWCDEGSLIGLFIAPVFEGKLCSLELFFYGCSVRV